MERRAFIKSSCNICLLGAAGVLLTQMTACSPASYPIFKTEVINDQLQIPIASFAQSNFQFVRPKGWYYDIAVRKTDNNTYEAILMKCTHQDTQLTPSGSGFSCSLHGSQFNKDGHVTKGPAELSLKQYPVTVDKDNLVIRVKS